MYVEDSHQLKIAAEEAPTPRKPGPGPADGPTWDMVADLQTRLDEAFQRVEELESVLCLSVEVDDNRLRQLELVCFAQGVSLRGTLEVIQVAFGEEYQPSLGQLRQDMKQMGRGAGDLLAKARGQVAGSLTCVMADDIYFHRTDVKVIAEAESMALLNPGIWDEAVVTTRRCGWRSTPARSCSPASREGPGGSRNDAGHRPCRGPVA